jgi:hypothetical protein
VLFSNFLVVMLGILMHFQGSLLSLRLALAVVIPFEFWWKLLLMIVWFHGTDVVHL